MVDPHWTTEWWGNTSFSPLTQILTPYINHANHVELIDEEAHKDDTLKSPCEDYVGFIKYKFNTQYSLLIMFTQDQIPNNAYYGHI